MADQLPGRYNFGTVLSGDTVPARTARFEMDLTGYQAKIQFRPWPGGTEVLTKEVGSGLTINGFDLVIGAFTAPTVDAQTKYHYDLQLTAPSGAVRTYLEGAMVVRADITR